MFPWKDRRRPRFVCFLAVLACLSPLPAQTMAAGVGRGAAAASPAAGNGPVSGGKGSLDPWWTASGKKYRAGKPFRSPMAWAPGQYLVLGESVDGKRQLVRKVLLVRREGKAWVVELETVDGSGLHLNQALVAGADEALQSADLSRLRLLWVRSIGKDGKIATTQGLALDLMSRVLRGQLALLVAKAGDCVPGGAMRVPAGSFAGTSLEIEISRGLFSATETRSWYNAAVPVNGLVKCASDNGKRIIELLGFGFNGKPEMTEALALPAH